MLVHAPLAWQASLAIKGSGLGRLRAAFLTAAILAAPFIAWLFRTEAGLVVMAMALCAGSSLLAGALGATPGQFHRWLRLGIGVNLALAAACVALAVWLLLR
jgi:hypothetical protein